jgi:hypothetical protein
VRGFGRNRLSRSASARSTLRSRARGRASTLAVLVLAGFAACSVDFAGSKPSQGKPLGDGDDSSDQDEGEGDGDGGDGDGDGDRGDGDGGDGDVPDPPKSCDGSPDGSSETRKRYPQAVVDNHAACVAETQTRSCADGTWSAWSGQAPAPECAVAALGVCKTGVPCAEGVCTPSKTNPFVSLCLRRNDASCADNNECVNKCISGVCAEASPAGGACDAANDCSSLACFGGGVGSATCEQNVCVCPNGSPCTANESCLNTCVDNECADKNNTCDFFDQDDCENATCTSGKCLRNDGADCSENAQCKNRCIADTCAPRSGLRGPCVEDADCGGSLLCSTSGTNKTCLKAADAPCMENTECLSASCVCPAAAAAPGPAPAACGMNMKVCAP